MSNTVQTGIGNEAKVYQNTTIADHFTTANGVYLQAQAMALSFTTPPAVPSLDLIGLTVNVTGGIVLTPVAPVHATNIMVPGTFNLNKTLDRSRLTHDQHRRHTPPMLPTGGTP
ncbi:MAG: hypothetical protein R3D67_11370 [Hyphomicrobiaceae bacterium]